MKTIIIVGALVALLIASAWWSFDVWTSVGDVEMQGPGIVAMVIGVAFTLAVGGGLMFLVFYSSRKGFDDLDGPTAE